MRQRFICIIVSAVLLFAGGQSFAQETVRIASGEYAPWTSKNIKGAGFTNHVISEAFARVGYRVEFEYYPWKRAFNSAKTGEKFHATSYWYYSDERTQFFHYSDPLQHEETVFFHLADNPPGDWQALSDLKGKRIGVTRGYTYTKEIWDAHESKALSIKVADTDEINFRKLLKGRIDLFLMETVVGKKLLRDKFSAEEASRITLAPTPVVETTAHLLFNKNRADAEAVMAAFNKGLAQIKTDGTYQKMEADLIAGGYDE